MSFLFLGNSRQHNPVFVKMISSWVRAVLTIPKVHMFLCTFQGAMASSTLVAGASVMSILQAGNWVRVSSLAKH